MVLAKFSKNVSSTKEYQKSIVAFNKAEVILDEYENRAQISLET